LEQSLPSAPAIEVEFLKYLREEKTFSSTEELQKQIRLDIQEAKAFFTAMQR
jgi:FAD synthase